MEAVLTRGEFTPADRAVGITLESDLHARGNMTDINCRVIILIASRDIYTCLLPDMDQFEKLVGGGSAQLGLPHSLLLIGIGSYMLENDQR